MIGTKKKQHHHKAVRIQAAGDGGDQVSVCACGKWRRWVRRTGRWGAEGAWQDAPAPSCGRAP